MIAKLSNELLDKLQLIASINHRLFIKFDVNHNSEQLFTLQISAIYDKKC